MKLQKPPAPLLFPTPLVLVTAVDETEIPNVIPISYIGIVATKPPTIGIAIKPERFSYEIIKKSEEFVVNIPSAGIIGKIDYAGLVTGRGHNKFSESQLTQEAARFTKAPLIKECPVNLECHLRNIIKVGDHDLFLGEVVMVHVEEDLVTKDGEIDFAKAQPLVLNFGEYWNLGRRIGEI
ncbi:MAG: flavin reductase family protein [Candidatus Ranarchaeia archaeon]|jgi:flavin reductase (DIM6/NTAB) family NADH-FMN oxidoreductase RutF